MAINPQKVLLIYNTNSDSRIQALNTQGGVNLRDWYAQVRGLTGGGGTTDYYYLGFDFGTAAQIGINGSYLGSPSIDGPNAITCTDSSPKMPSQVGIKLPTALANISNLYNLEAVFVMPGVPRQVAIGNPIPSPSPPSSGSNYGNNQYLEIYFAVAMGKGASFPNGYIQTNFIQEMTSTMGPLITDATPNYTQNHVPNGYYRTAAPKPLTKIRSFSGIYPTYYGRIGWVFSDGSGTDPDFNYAWGCSNFVQTQTIVNNAIAAEQVNNFSKLHILGGSAYVEGSNFGLGGTLASIAVNKLGISAGLTTTYIEDNPSVLPEVQLQGPTNSERGLWDGYPQPPSNQPAYPAYPDRPMWWGGAWPVFQTTPGAQRAQGITGGNYQLTVQGYGTTPIQPFCLISPKIYPVNSDPVAKNYLSFAPGGFSFGWGSACTWLQDYSLRNGASMSFGCGGEPFGLAIVDSDALLYWLLNGFTGSEAVYKAGVSCFKYTGQSVGWTDSTPNGFFPALNFGDNWGLPPKTIANGCRGQLISVLGDPLYAPYKAHNLQPRLMQVG